MQPLTNVKQVRSFLGLVNQLGKFSPDYSMIRTKIRTLLKTGVKFVWTPDHQAEFDKVIQSLSDLEKLEPYCRSSILQAGSTSLKHAQVRWAIPELELLAVKFMLNKCHFYTAWATKTIVIYSDCKGLKQY